MDTLSFSALLPFLTAIAGTAIGFAGTIWTTKLQADRADSRESRLANRQAMAQEKAVQVAAESREVEIQVQAAIRQELATAKRVEFLEQKREAFLGQVFLTQQTMTEWLSHVQSESPKSSDVSTATEPLSYARQEAYALALLYLPALRPLAKEFYVATAKLQLALQAANGAGASVLVGSWLDSFKAIENAVPELIASDQPK